MTRMRNRRLPAVAAVAWLCAAVPSPARAAFFSGFLDGVTATLQTRSASGLLEADQQRAVDKALSLVAQDHRTFSQDLRTAARIAKLVARKLPADTELDALVAAGLGAMEAAVAGNAADAGVTLAFSGLPPLKQAKWFARVARPQAAAAQTTDRVTRAKLFAKSQTVIEKILAKYGT
jgi:hypothetical protein